MSLDERLKQKAKTFYEIEKWFAKSRNDIRKDEGMEWVRLADVLAIVKEEKQKLQQIIELLKEVAEKRGAYSQDQLTHAENVIENVSIRAKKAIELLEEALK